MDKKTEIIPIESITQKILFIRGQKVLVDKDLAELYEVPTMRLNEQVKRNRDRFPGDFMFQLTKKEKDEVIANCDNLSSLKFSPTMPYVFTEHGVAMLSSVLRSPQAVQMNIFIIRAFIKIRELLSLNKDLAHKVGELEREQIKQGKVITLVYSMLKQLEKEPPATNNPIGFRTEG